MSRRVPPRMPELLWNFPKSYGTSKMKSESFEKPSKILHRAPVGVMSGVVEVVVEALEVAAHVVVPSPSEAD